MGRSETHIRNSGCGADESSKEDEGFFACYLLASISPRHKGHTYIGFTNNPRRRIRQHNGEITSGAWRTKSKRPWEMVLCIYGFPTNVTALQFEWAWQHPMESLAVRKAAASFKSFSGISNKIKLAYTMLNLPGWQGLNLTVNFFSTKYKSHSGSCPKLSQHMKIRVCAMEDLPLYNKESNDLCGSMDEDGDNEECEGISGSDGNIEEENQNSIENPEKEMCGEIEKLQGVEDWFGLFGKGSSGFCFEESELSLPETLPILDERKTKCSEVEESKIGSPKTPIVDRRKKKSSEIEVIDLLSPPSECRISSWSAKKRKIPDGFPLIIDLTSSPIFVQL